MIFSRLMKSAGVVLLSGFFNLATAVETPTSLEGATTVTAEQVKQMMDKGVPVIDARTATEFAEGHVKGATLVTYKEKSEKKVGFDASNDKFDLSKLPADKNAPVVLYCNAGDCWKSFKAGTMAVKAGHTKVQWMRGGFPEWKSKGYPVE